MVAVNSTGEVLPLYLKDLRGDDGRIKTRLVNLNSQKVTNVYANLHYLTTEDREQAKEYLQHPEEYEFNKILNW